MTVIQTSMSVSLFSRVNSINDDPQKLVKDPERYAQLVGLNDEDLPTIANVSCTGSVADFEKDIWIK